MCSLGFNSSSDLLILASTIPEVEFLINKRLSLFANSKALTIELSERVTFVPAVKYKPASIIQLFPNGIPKP